MFDYVFRSFVEGDQSGYGSKQLFRYCVQEMKEPFLFGLNPDETEPFMRERGFEIVSDLGPAELAELYLRRSDGSLLARPWDVLRMCYARVP